MSVQTTVSPPPSLCTWNVQRQRLGKIDASLRPEAPQQDVQLHVRFAHSTHNEADVVYSVRFDRHRWQVHIQHRRSLCQFIESYRVKKVIEARLFKKWKPIQHLDAEPGFGYCHLFKGEALKPTQTDESPTPLQYAANENDDDFVTEETEPLLALANHAHSASEAPINNKERIAFCDHYSAIEKWVKDYKLQHCKISHRVEIEQKYLVDVMKQIWKHDLPTSDGKVLFVPIRLTKRGWFNKPHAVLAVITKDAIFIIDPKSNRYPLPLCTLNTGFQARLNTHDCTRHTLYTLKSLLPMIEQHIGQPAQFPDPDMLLSKQQIKRFLANIQKKNREDINEILAHDSK